MSILVPDAVAAVDDRIEVTDANFGELLIQGLEEAVAIEAGELSPTRLRRRKVATRQ